MHHYRDPLPRAARRAAHRIRARRAVVVALAPRPRPRSYALRSEATAYKSLRTCHEHVSHMLTGRFRSSECAPHHFERYVRSIPASRAAAPTSLSTVRASSARRSFGCMLSGSSPISSRKTVPPSAASMAPARGAAGVVLSTLAWRVEVLGLRSHEDVTCSGRIDRDGDRLRTRKQNRQLLRGLCFGT
jgi:hypothetical protein